MKVSVRLPLTAEGRLDRAVADALGVGRAAVKQAFAAGEVRLRGRRARASDPAPPGALVELELAERAGPPVPEGDAPLRVLAEGGRWLVADKPAGVATHPLQDGEGGTLANAVVARHPECAEASPDPREGGAVQRLDLETSGCVLFAKDRGAWEALHARLAAREVEKLYLALVAGRVAAGGVCSVPLAQRGGRVVAVPDPERPPKTTGKPREAETRYEVRRTFPAHTLLEVHIATGVMHQIRAHLALLGHPVAGDLTYGGAAAALPGLERHFLHAAALGFEKPEGGRARVESPLPAELEAVLRALDAA
jgi:23S rRNA pseudouridine1911/1915/1917 synthase